MSAIGPANWGGYEIRKQLTFNFLTHFSYKLVFGSQLSTE